MNDLTVFLGQMIRRPGQVSALAPSSKRLARAMAAGLGPQSGLVAELGPGTGKITRAILETGLPCENLTVFELNQVFCRRLAATFPGLRIENNPAQDMQALGLNGLDAVISGLPLLSMSPWLQHSIVDAAFASLKPDGVFVQFTYGPRPPLDPGVQRDLHLKVDRGPHVLVNIPPARVYHYRRS
ncbi:class I SAM-dependent methyltransferase [Phaeovulum sp.]|uniref:class I SAM-dependent methyltransferase n=1 Tax=Phaeovulum sp. TaxID=2934796 RepID=UPI0039E49F30